MRVVLMLLPVVSAALLAALAVPAPPAPDDAAGDPAPLAPHPGRAASLPVPLRVTEPAGIARHGDLVRSGIPLPRAAGVLDPSTLALVDEATGRPLPARFRTLSRWGGPPDDARRPLRFVLVTARIDLSPRETRALRLARGPGADPGDAVPAFEVRDGALRTPAGPLSLRMDGRPLDDLSVRVAEDDGLSRRIVLTGRFPRAAVDARIAYTLVAGRPEVRADVTLVNRGSFGFRHAPEHAWFGSVDAVLALDEPAAAARVDGVLAPLGNGGVRLLQRHEWRDPRDQGKNFRFELNAGGEVLARGSRARGAISLETPGGPVAAALAEFWEGFPSALSASPRELRIELWPAGAAGPAIPGDPRSSTEYRLDGGRQKTRSFLLRFGAGADDLPERLAKPLALRADPAWVERTGALGPLHLGGAALPPEVAPAARRFARLLRVRYDASAADSRPGFGRIDLRAWLERGGPFGGKQGYGWLHYGDIPWACGQCSGHYDWPAGLLLSWLETGDRAAFDLGAAMARHRRDVDQYHGRDHPVFAGGQFYEKGERHGDAVQSPVPSHTWVGGLSLYYLLTGDPLSLDALREVRRFYDGYWVGYQRRDWNADFGEVRAPGWSLLGLARIHAATGDRTALALARDIVRGVAAREADSGGRGYVLAPNGNVGTAYPWQHGILLTGLAAYLDEAGPDPVARALMDRIARWLREDCLTGGRREPGGYVPLAVLRSWRPDGGQAPGHEGSDIAHDIHLVDGLARAAIESRDLRHLDAARALFRDFVRYWQEVPGRPVPDGHLSPITFAPARFPETESKIFGWIGRYGRAYLMAERRVEASRRGIRLSRSAGHATAISSRSVTHTSGSAASRSSTRR